MMMERCVPNYRLLREHEAMYDEKEDSDDVKPPERKPPSTQTTQLTAYLKALKSGAVTAIRHHQSQEILDVRYILL